MPSLLFLLFVFHHPPPPPLYALLAAGVSYDRMLQALQTATMPETLSVCPVVRGLIVDSLFPTLDRIAEVEKAGGMRPGIGDAVLPPGVMSPGMRGSSREKRMGGGGMLCCIP